MPRYRCFFFDAAKLTAAKEYENKVSAETTARFGLRWGQFDRVEIWADHQKLVAWAKHDEQIQDTL